MLRIGHRGTSQGATENTVSAFRKAMRDGGDGVELDIRMTKDGVLVISHDPTINRLTGYSGYIKEMELEDLKRLSIMGDPAQRIATSEEAFDAILESGKPNLIQVDLKVGGVARKLLDQIYERNLQDVVVISSFHKGLLKEVRELDRSIKTGLIKILPFNGPIEYLASETEGNRLKRKAKDVLYRLYQYAMLPVNLLTGSAHSDLISDAKGIGANYVMFFWGAGTKSFVRRAHANNLGVVAGIVNTEKRMHRMESMGVDAAVTDLSSLLRSGKYAQL